VEVSHRHEVELQCVGDPHSPGASERPDGVPIDLLDGVVGGDAETAAAIDVVDAPEGAAGETVATHQPADAAPKRVARDRDAGRRSRQAQQAVSLGGGVDRRPGRAGSHRRDPILRIDRDEAQR
jgi:hypothetical protein